MPHYVFIWLLLLIFPWMYLFFENLVGGRWGGGGGRVLLASVAIQTLTSDGYMGTFDAQITLSLNWPSDSVELTSRPASAIISTLSSFFAGLLL